MTLPNGIDPRTPVIVGVAQAQDRGNEADPIAMMGEVLEAALGDTGSETMRRNLETLRIIQGVWPFGDPGALVANDLGLDVRTECTGVIGGNEVYDHTVGLAVEIQRGDREAVAIVAAETMRTRRGDAKAGRETEYRVEPPEAPESGLTRMSRDKFDPAVIAAGVIDPVNFYAMAESALRHRLAETVATNTARTSAMWSRASEIASRNPDAWMRETMDAAQVAAPGPGNRMVASPYPKLMTSNVNVNQAAGVIMCSAERAAAAGVPIDRWVFPLAGAGAADVGDVTSRLDLDDSPAMRIAGAEALSLAGIGLGDVKLVDLYSCFPSAVMVSARALGLPQDRDFTISGGLTFAGGPFNSYCLHTLARAVDLLRADAAGTTALLTGNGGYFSKHSFLVAGNAPPPAGFRAGLPQAAVDALGARPTAPNAPENGTLEAYTVTFDRDGAPDLGIAAVLDAGGARTWANSRDPQLLDRLHTSESCGASVQLTAAGVDQTPVFSLA